MKWKNKTLIKGKIEFTKSDSQKKTQDNVQNDTKGDKKYIE